MADIYRTFTLRFEERKSVPSPPTICITRKGASMKSKLKPVPRFKTEAEERMFWETHDSTEYVDWSTAQRVRFPDLKPSTQAISLRLPASLLEQIKVEANRR